MFTDTTNGQSIDRAVYLSVGNSGPQMVVTPLEDFITTAYRSNTISKDYIVSNNGSEQFTWVASSQQAWIRIDPDGGTLYSGDQGNQKAVRISLNTEGLTEFKNSGLVKFWDGRIANGVYIDKKVELTLMPNQTVNDPSGLKIITGENLSVNGPLGGPFKPETTVHTLLNPTQSEMRFKVYLSYASWLNINLSEFTLMPGESKPLVLTVNNGVANKKGQGYYEGRLYFEQFPWSPPYYRVDIKVSLTIGPRRPVYTLTDLGTLGGDSWAYRVNNHGQVVGTSSRSDGIGRAFLWDTASGMRDLGTLGGEHDPNHGLEDARATAINDRGEVVGWAIDDTGSKRAFLWKAGETWGVSSNPEMKSLGTLGGADDPDDYYALDISNLGQVVGATSSHAWLWTPGDTNGVPSNPEMRDLGCIETAASAIAINDYGVVVGHTYVGGQFHAFRWTPGGTAGPPSNPQMQDLGVLPGAVGSAAFDINNRGEVVGVSWFPGVENLAHAVYWSPTNEIYDMGFDPGGDFSSWYSLSGINMGGLMVGECIVTGLPEHTMHWVNTFKGGDVQDASVYPLLWNWNNGEISGLNDHIEDTFGWTLGFVKAINDPGQIVGAMFNNNTSFDHPRAYVATPLEEMGIPMLGLGESRQLSTSLPNTDIHFTLTGGCGCSNVHTWLATEVADPTPTGAWTAVGNKLKIDTDAAQGDFKMLVRISYDQVDLGHCTSVAEQGAGLDDSNSTFTECVLDLLSSDETTGQYQLAAAANTTGEATRYISHISGEYAPGVTDGSQMALGSYGVNTADNFVWAVVDHAGDFSTGYRREIDNLVFADPVNYGAGSWPYDIVMADLDRDGDVDIAIANTGVVSTGYWDGSLSVLLNNGDGTYGTPTNYVAGHAPVCVAAGDVNGDSFTDLAIANVHGNNISLFINNRDGTFPDPVTYSVGSNPQGIGFGDIDSDGDADMVVANRSLGSSKGTIWILSNDGNGTFSHDQSYTVGREPISLVVTDLNGDGYLDVAVANYGGSVSVLKNQGNGALGDLRTYAVSGGPWTIKAAPIDQDDAFDLVVACYNGHRLEILRNLGNGEFESASQYDVPTVSEGLVLQDLDFDGDFDIVAANNNTPGMSLFLNQGDGTFICSPSALGGGSQIACDDLNRDGLYDLIFSRSRQNVVSVLMNLSEINASVDSDFNDDGVVNLLDVATLSLDWLKADCANETDLTCDSRIDFDDVLLFARHWLEQIH